MIELATGFLAVAAGAMIGGPLRFFVSGVVARRFGETFPWGTLAVNVTGAFIIGLVASFAAARNFGPASLPLLAVSTGILGSFTTVSSFSLQTLNLLRDGEYRRAILNVVMSLALGLMAAGAGDALGRLWWL